RPNHTWWVVPTAEAFPRLSVVTAPREGALGPFPSRRAAAVAVDTVLDVVPMRPCTQRIPAQGASAAPCALHEMGRCAAPCAGLRYGRLAAAGVARRGVAPMPVIDALRLGAQTVLPAAGPLRGAPVEEVRLLHRWLTTGGTRLVASEPAWTEPARGAGSWGAW